MLKIKDNIDLKELEKFRFEYDDYLEEYVKSINSLKTKGMFVPYVHTGELFIKKDRTIYDKIENIKLAKIIIYSSRGKKRKILIMNY